jgi:hypothetical protein
MGYLIIHYLAGTDARPWGPPNTRFLVIEQGAEECAMTGNDGWRELGGGQPDARSMSGDRTGMPCGEHQEEKGSPDGLHHEP